MDGRDPNTGRFSKGHPDFVKAAGVKSGRPRELKRQVRDALDLAEAAMPSIFATLVELAKSGNVQAANILIERIYGKPRQESTVTMNVPKETFVLIAGGECKTARDLKNDA